MEEVILELDSKILVEIGLLRERIGNVKGEKKEGINTREDNMSKDLGESSSNGS